MISNIEELPMKLKSRVDELVDIFWRYGIGNAVVIIEQLSYLLLVKYVDNTYKLINKEVNPLTWYKLINSDHDKAFDYYLNRLFSFLNLLEAELGLNVNSINEIKVEIPNSLVFRDCVQLIDDICFTAEQNNVSIGIIYTYLLTKVTGKGNIGQNPTPPHIIECLIKMIQPKLGETFCDPACGTGGFILGLYRNLFVDGNKLVPPENILGLDHDMTMVRFARFHLFFNGVAIPNIVNADSLREEHQGKSFDIVMMNPPFSNKIKYDYISQRLKNNIIPSTKTGFPSELLFSHLALSLLKKNGRCAIILPEGTFSSQAIHYKNFREIILNDYRIDGIISLPSGTFKPYSGVKTSVLFVSKIDNDYVEPSTEKVWFYEVTGDGFTLNDKRMPSTQNDLPNMDIWNNRDEDWKTWKAYQRKEIFGKQFPPNWNNSIVFASYDEIKKNDYNLSVSIYRPVHFEPQLYVNPKEIINKIIRVEEEINNDLLDLLSQLNNLQVEINVTPQLENNILLNSEKHKKIDPINVKIELDEQENNIYSEILTSYSFLINNLAQWQNKLLQIFYKSKEPLPCHLANKKLGDQEISIQDVLQTVHLFESFGLLEMVDSESICYPKDDTNTLGDRDNIEVNGSNITVKIWRPTKAD